MEILTYILVAIAAVLLVIPIVFVWYLCFCGIYVALRDWKVARAVKRRIATLTCSIDTDCPEGYICVNGHCIPAH